MNTLYVITRISFKYECDGHLLTLFDLKYFQFAGGEEGFQVCTCQGLR